MTDESTLERLVRLETKTCLKFKELEKALVIAKEAMDYRLRHLNEFQSRMDKLESTFATDTELKSLRELLEDKLLVLSRLVWIGFGVIVTAEFFLRMFQGG